MIYAMSFACLAAALVLTAFRLYRGSSAADRILAIDLLAVITAAAVLPYVLASGERVLLDVVVLGIIVFFGTVALARTISRLP